MRAIRNANTQPEVALRKGLHARGYRFRLNLRGLPGTPDIVFPKYRAVVFVHGCFWHRHECQIFKWPKGNAEKWRSKLDANWQRDQAAVEALQQAGWRVLVCWECALRGPGRLGIDSVVQSVAAWLHSDTAFMEVRSGEFLRG